MHKPLGCSIYASHFEEQKQWLTQLAIKERRVFTSLHIPEEVSSNYASKIKTMLAWLKSEQFYVIADVSHHTLKFLNVKNLTELVEAYPIDNLRIDFGISYEELATLPRHIDLTINASTQQKQREEILRLKDQLGHKIMVMHNFYPRPETGLDIEQFVAINQTFKKDGFEVLAFIAGDTAKRGPLALGLPTVEVTRHLPPVLAYRQLLEWSADAVFLGDLALSTQQLEAIDNYVNQDVMDLPVRLEESYKWLYDRVLTIRLDSPKMLLRVSDLRENLVANTYQPDKNPQKREKGSITIDNCKYGRYEGELQILGRNLPADEKVNVIGHLTSDYHSIFDLDNSDQKIRFRRVSDI